MVAVDRTPAPDIRWEGMVGTAGEHIRFVPGIAGMAAMCCVEAV